MAKGVGQDQDFRIGSIVIDCNDFEKTATFWKEALHYATRDPPSATIEGMEGGWVLLKDPKGKGPNLGINLKPNPLSRKIRVHIDLYADDAEAEVQRLLKLGASIVKPHEEGTDYTILADPEGNHFCIVQNGGP